MFVLDDGIAASTAVESFIEDLRIALIPRFIAESALGVKLEPNDAEKEAINAACFRLKQAVS